jgi:hypothetical protein
MFGILMNRKYTFLFLTFMSGFYIYRNHFKKDKIDNSSQTDNSIQLENKEKDENELNKKEIKPLTPIKNLARKGGIVETVLNLEIIAEPGLFPGIGLIEGKDSDSSKSELEISEEKKVTFDLKLEIDGNNYNEDSEEDETLCILGAH